MTREEAIAFVRERVKSENLIRHMLAVEAAVRSYARDFGEDEEIWGLAALLHDADYEQHPAEHPDVVVHELQEREVASEVIHAIAAHGDHTGISRTSRLDKTLYACDEVTGLIMATALMRPTQLEGLETASVLKKMKDKRFAAGVDRERVVRGAEELGVPLDEHIGRVIEAMRAVSAELGLSGAS